MTHDMENDKIVILKYIYEAILSIQYCEMEVPLLKIHFKADVYDYTKV